MNLNFSAKWQQLETRVNALSVRERAMLAGVAAVVLLGLTDQLLLRPWLGEREKAEVRIQGLKSENEKTTQAMTALEQQLANDPNRLLREKIEKLNTRHEKVDAGIAKITDGMIAPELMPNLLGELLSGRSGLKVQSIKTRPAEKILTSEKNDDNGPAIYRHDLELSLEGSFAQVQQYLQSIEDLPARMIWDDFVFSVDHYPKGELRLAVHTLSAREELIRVSH